MSHFWICLTTASTNARYLFAVKLLPFWVISSFDPLIICKTVAHIDIVVVTITLKIAHNLSWTLSINNKDVPVKENICFSNESWELQSVSAVLRLMMYLDSMRLCVGNSEPRIVMAWKQQQMTLHGNSGVMIML